MSSEVGTSWLETGGLADLEIITTNYSLGKITAFTVKHTQFDSVISVLVFLKLCIVKVRLPLQNDLQLALISAAVVQG